MHPKIQRPLAAIAFGVQIGCLAYLVLWAASDATSHAGPPSVTVPDPRTIAGKLQPKPQSRGMSLAYPAFNVIEPVSDDGKRTFRTWHLVTTSIEQEAWMEHHIGSPVLAVGRRGEREGNFYFLVDAIRETR